MALNGSNRIKIRLEKSPLVVVNTKSIENIVKSTQYKDIRLEIFELKEKKASLLCDKRLAKCSPTVCQVVFIIQLKTYHTFFKQAGSVGNNLVVSGDDRTWCFRKGCSMRLM